MLNSLTKLESSSPHGRPSRNSGAGSSEGTFMSDEDTSNSVDDVQPHKHSVPKGVYFICAMYFFERFAFYGIRAFLVIFLRNKLRFSENISTTIFHSYIFLALILPMVGGFIADSWLGKFRTTVSFSLVALVGYMLQTTVAIPYVPVDPRGTTMISLAIIATGSGLIKACVASFGADQFKMPDQADDVGGYFSVFYICITAGSSLSLILIPIVRKDVACFSEKTCYPLAFGLPALAMLVSLVIFLSGSSYYKKSTPLGNVFGEIVRMVLFSLKRKYNSKKETKHWMDHAMEIYPDRDVEDAKILLQILWLYLPLPLYWTLYEQQGTRWTFQATRMDDRIGSYTIKPDQIVFIPEIMVVILIPIFNKWIYPTLGKFGLLRKPLQRMTAGGIVLAIAFVCAGFLELKIQKTGEISPGHSRLQVINMVDTDYKGEVRTLGNVTSHWKFEIKASDTYYFLNSVPAGDYELELVGVKEKTSFIMTSGKIFTVVIYLDMAKEVRFISPKHTSSGTVLESIGKAMEEEATLRVIQAGLWEDCIATNLSACDVKDGVFVRQHDCSFHCDTKFGSSEKLTDLSDHLYSAEKQMQSGWFTALYKGTALGQFELDYKNRYVYVVIYNVITGAKTRLQKLDSPIQVHMAWLLPQLTLLALSSMLLPVTILDFSYKEAPPTMKSILQGCWLMTVAAGNLISAIIAAIDIFTYQWKEFFFMSGLMFIDMLIFAFMAKHYKPADLDYDEDDKVNTAIEVMGTVAV